MRHSNKDTTGLSGRMVGKAKAGTWQTWWMERRTSTAVQTRQIVKDFSQPAIALCRILGWARHREESDFVFLGFRWNTTR